MQNVKKYLIIMVAITFGVAVIAACITLFSVKKVAADFSVYGDSQAESIQEDLDALKGRNMIFLKSADVYAICEKYPYYEITSVKKQYPNVLKISVKKRTEAFTVEYGDKTFVLDENGVVLNDTGKTEFPQNVVSVSLGELTVNGAVCGAKIATSDDGLFYSFIQAFGMVGFNSVVDKVDLQLDFDGENYKGRAVFRTRTGVEIKILNFEDDGERKINSAFEKYETLTDYEKTAYSLIVSKNVNTGEIYADWSEETEI